MKIRILFIMLTGTLFSDIGSDFVKNGGGALELRTHQYINLVIPFLPENPNILEAGARYGLDTVRFARNWPKGHIFAFEPVKVFYDRMINSVQRGKFTNVSTFNFGLFSKTGLQSFYYAEKCGGASSFLPDNGVCDYGDKMMILPCRRADEWAAEHNVTRIDFMWLDMEGAEIYMLKAAKNLLATTKVILTEINFREFRTGSTTFDELKSYLESQGFTLHKIWGSATWQATGMFVKSDLL